MLSMKKQQNLRINCMLKLAISNVELIFWEYISTTGKE